MGSPSDPDGHAAGVAFAPQSSRRMAARLVWRGADAKVLDDQNVLLTGGTVLRVEHMPDSPALVYLDNGWLFEAATGSDLASLDSMRPDRWLSWAKAWHPRLMVFALGCLVFAWGIWKWGVGVIVALAVAVTPDSVVWAIDRSNVEMLDRVLADKSALDDAKRQQVQAIFDDLVRHAPPAPGGDYRLLFRDLPAVGPNAFAMPGGTVVITDQLVQDFDDADILAGVLGHELAHVSEQHILTQLYRAGTTYLLIALIAGDPGPLLSDMLREGNAMLSLSYSRQHEAEADRMGVRIATEAGYDGAALARFFDQLQQEYGSQGPAWLSSHPASDERARQIRDYARQNG
ncbi:MAG: M48 family metallopeptidase [Paracoccus sp. (in: a-proteobacteria)]|uniref:M48 family metallopeptidase n=1 Tax=Paracoccus sp. TaxID=267 RepID=UPI0026DFB610|nr:M48 family metallopeptidase [Paracoccus sp. (in: a-proteobacteria)]MDO5632793.1 M48 family metallopeptidase [Paracoccus sp. (in: a-proteobacteria)]